MCKKKYRILIFIPNLGCGGAERVVVNLLKGLDKNALNVNLVVTNIRKEGFMDQLPKNGGFCISPPKGIFQELYNQSV